MAKLLKMSKKKEVIFLCDGKKCCRYNDEVKSCFKKLVKKNDLKEQLKIEKTKCQGMCKKAPVVCISKKECIGEITVKEAEKLFYKLIG